MIPVLAALLAQILHSLARREVGLDIVAALSMSAALIFGETLAAAVVALMYSGGTFLEGFAAGRARREMTDLLSRVPRTATLHRGDGLVEVALDRIGPGDLLLIRQGAVAPVDGTVAGPGALLDQSALTGESMPLRRTQGQEVMSGSTIWAMRSTCAPPVAPPTAPMPASSAWWRPRRPPRRRWRVWPTGTRCCSWRSR